MNLYNLPIHSDSPKIINAVVEIPRGTSAKYEYDSEMGVFKLDRCLMSAMVYPASYGFIPSTLAADGDALDVIVYNAQPVDRGVLVECNVIGCLDMYDNGVADYKVLACPTSHVKEYYTIDDVDPVFLRVAENFFQHYKELDDKHVSTSGWVRREETYDIINDSIINFKNRHQEPRRSDTQ